MFDHRLMPIAPSGAMSPVETSSATTIVTRPAIVSAGGSPFGGGTVLSGRGVSAAGAAAGPGGAASWGGAADACRPRDLGGVRGVGLRRRDDLAVVDLRARLHRADVRGLAEGARVGDLAAQRGRRRRGGGAEVDPIAVGPAAAGEVAVERAHRRDARRR